MTTTRRVLALPPLRPYVPDRLLLRRILAGHRILAGRAWAAARTGLRRATATKTKTGGLADTLERLGVGTVAVVITATAATGAATALGPRLLPYAPTAASAAVIGLLGAAWAVAPTGEQSRPESPLDPEPTPPKGEPPALDADTVADTIRDIAGKRGWKGAHLDDIADHLPGHTKDHILAVLGAAGIEVADQLKLTLPGGRPRNRRGVRLAALPGTHATPGSEPAPPAAQAVPHAPE